VSPCCIFGYYNHPESWVLAEDTARRIGDFYLEFDSYESCRKWAISNIIDKRKSLGKSMDLWLTRGNFDGRKLY